jgi:hypothetical protein
MGLAERAVVSSFTTGGRAHCQFHCGGGRVLTKKGGSYGRCPGGRWQWRRWRTQVEGNFGGEIVRGEGVLTKKSLSGFQNLLFIIIIIYLKK